MRLRRIVAVAIVTALLRTAGALADPVAVRHIEGTNRGLLALRATDGRPLASGEQTQTVSGDRITIHLVFRFKDGSLSDERTTFSQRGTFRLIRYQLAQKGPSFPRAIDMTIDAASGQVVVHSTDDHGESKTDTEHLELPPDVSNGMMNTVLKNVQPAALPVTVSYVAATPKPRVVKLVIQNGGLAPFSAAGASYKATHYVIKIDIGGIEGLLAPLVGKEPPDSHVWILRGEAPVFVRSETTFYLGGPTWRIEPASIGWPAHARSGTVDDAGSEPLPHDERGRGARVRELH